MKGEILSQFSLSRTPQVLIEFGPGLHACSHDVVTKEGLQVLILVAVPCNDMLSILRRFVEDGTQVRM